MKMLPHAPGYTLSADAFMGPGELVGFSIANHPRNIFTHFHDFYELALITQGTGVHVTSGSEQRIRPGYVIFVPPGVSHGYHTGDSLVVYNCFVRSEAARFDISWAQRDPGLAFLFGPAGGVPQQPIVRDLDDEAFADCLAHLEAIRLRDGADRSEAFDLGHLLLALDVLSRRIGPDDVVHGVPSPAAPAIVRAAVRLLEEDLRRHWTLDELAGELCVGLFYLVHLFKRWVGMPPIAFGNLRRAERAAVLLASTDDPIAVIGAEVGWADPSHFGRRFRQLYGASPRAFRARSRALKAQPTRPPAGDAEGPAADRRTG